VEHQASRERIRLPGIRAIRQEIRLPPESGIELLGERSGACQVPLLKRSERVLKPRSGVETECFGVEILSFPCMKHMKIRTSLRSVVEPGTSIVPSFREHQRVLYEATTDARRRAVVA